MKKTDTNIIAVGVKEEKKKNQFVEAVKFGFGFYIGFSLGRMLKRAFLITNCK